MSSFHKIENFPFTVERENGEITPVTIYDYQTMKMTRVQLENIFNDNARIQL